MTGDMVLPFRLETRAARGRLVRLGAAVDRIVAGRDYPAPVATLLGELAALAGLLSPALEDGGVLTVQVKGDGAVGLLVADATADGAMRGYARYDAAALARRGGWRAAPVPELVGAGRLAVTVDRGGGADRSQGVAELDGRTVAECAEAHFRRSAQGRAAFALAAAPGGGSEGGDWRAGGMMIQRPAEPGRPRLADEEGEEGWRRAVALLGSCAPSELADGGLHPHDLLYRLFHEDGVRVFAPRPLVHGCRCSEDRVAAMLRSFPRAEIEALGDDGDVAVTCEFCGVRYPFDDRALDRVYRVH